MNTLEYLVKKFNINLSKKSPFYIPIGTVSMGPSLILAGGLLGLIGGINRSGW